MLVPAIIVGVVCFLAGVGVFMKLSSQYKLEGERLAQVRAECEQMAAVSLEPIQTSAPSSPLPTTPLLLSSSMPSGNPTPVHDVTVRSVGAMSRQMSGTSANSSTNASLRVPHIPTTSEAPSSPRLSATTNPSHRKRQKKHPQSSRSRSYRDMSRYESPLLEDVSIGSLQVRSSEVSARRKEFSHKLSDHILQMSSALQLAQGKPGAPMRTSHSARSLDAEDTWSFEPRSPQSSHSPTRYDTHRVWSPTHHHNFYQQPSHFGGKM